MKHTVYGIRTNQWGFAEQEQYNRLLQVTASDNIFVIADEMNGTVETPETINKISWDMTFIEQNDLLNYRHFNRPIGWLCGDYALYAFAQNISAQYYWLIEPDVTITFDDVAQFFKSFEDFAVDGFFPNLRKLNNNDYWYQPSQLIYDQPHGCLFPFIRLSQRAIQTCLIERQRLSLFYKDKQKYSNTDYTFPIHFPNDESLVVNTLLRNRLIVKNVTDVYPYAFDHLTFEHPFGPIDLADNTLKNNIIHPVRTNEQIINHLSKHIINSFNTDELATISRNDIPIISTAVASNLAAYLQETFTTHYQKETYFRHLKQCVYRILKNFPTSYSMWIYKNHTLVLDVHQNSDTHTIEWSMSDNHFNCFIFSRTSSEWIANVSKKHPDIPWLHQKLHVFNINTEQKDALDTSIDQALTLFFNQIS